MRKAKQLPSAAFLRFCRVTAVMYPQVNFYKAMKWYVAFGNKSVARMQAKGFVFNVENTRALVKQLNEGDVPKRSEMPGAIHLRRIISQGQFIAHMHNAGMKVVGW